MGATFCRDNRQDAALQAGHFNDFMETVHSGGSHRAWPSALVRRPPHGPRDTVATRIFIEGFIGWLQTVRKEVASLKTPRFVKDEASSPRDPEVLPALAQGPLPASPEAVERAYHNLSVPTK